MKDVLWLTRNHSQLALLGNQDRELEYLNKYKSKNILREKRQLAILRERCHQFKNDQ